MPIEQNEIFRNVDGTDVGTGLWVPDRKEETHEPLLKYLQTRVDMKDVQDILADPRRKTARERFPSARFIRSQGSRGSCNGYAIAKALERCRVARGLEHVPLSGEFIYAAINGGRDQGSGLAPGMKHIEKVGTSPESMVKHQEYLWKNIPEQAKAVASQFRGVECYAAPDEENLTVGIALGFIAVVAVHFSSRMQQLDSNGVAGSSRGRGNHSVGVDDIRIRNGRVEFDYFNSHGLRYGQEGKAWLVWDKHFKETTRFHQFFLVRSTTNAKNDPQL